MRAALFVMLLLAGCPAAVRPSANGTGPTPPTPAPGTAPRLFPLEQGTTWTFRGRVKWHDARARKDREVDVEWLVECTEVIRAGDAVGYVLRGFPADLVWSEGEAQRGDWLLVNRGKRWYVDRASPDDLARFRAAPTVDTGDLLLEEPLTDGRRMCKDDTTHCWDVTADGAAFDLTYRTNPDTTVVEITPGQGITAYDYVHHGTTSEVHVRRVP